MNWTQVSIFATLFLLVSVAGFLASRWRRPKDMEHLDEWGLGGRSFGSWVTWFLIGGDLYTAYTFVALPAVLFTIGAAGFFAVPYTVMAYPLAFFVLIRLWSVSRRRGFVTPADFVRSRFDSPVLALLVAITGIVATMPYIALQLVGIEAVLKAMGIVGHWPIVVAFVILAAYTYRSGLRAPAMIAFVKDALIYIVVLTAVIYIPYKLGGWGKIFDAADAKFTAAKTGGLLLNPNNQLQYITVAFGSALALFLYPHSVTGVLASRSREAIKRNMTALPAYSVLLGLVALLGFMAIAAQIVPLRNPDGTVDRNTVVPLLFDKMFPDWFTGIAFAAIGIGALVPAAIMSIAAANLFTRNIYKEFLHRTATAQQEARVSKVTSLLVKFGALLCILLINPQFSLDLQLIGGVIILQTLPSVALGLFTRWMHRWALAAGLIAGMSAGLWMLYQVPGAPGSGKQHFGSAAFPLSAIGIDTKMTVYVGLIAVVVNLAVTVIGTSILRAAAVSPGIDGTAPEDYTAGDSDSDSHRPADGDDKPDAFTSLINAGGAGPRL